MSKRRTREEYQARKAARVCVDCKSDLAALEGHKGVRCPECAAVSAAAKRRYNRSAKGRAAAKRCRSREAAKARMAERQRRRRLERKMRGQCLYCSEPAGDESVFCALHQEQSNDRCRDYSRRKQEAKRTGKPIKLRKRKISRAKQTHLRVVKGGKPDDAPTFKSMSPIADWRDGEIGLGEAAVRFVELCNGITMQDLGDEFAIDHEERDRVGHALIRATRSGRIRYEGVRPNRVYYPNRQRRAA